MFPLVIRRFSKNDHPILFVFRVQFTFDSFAGFGGKILLNRCHQFIRMIMGRLVQKGDLLAEKGVEKGSVNSNVVLPFCF